MSARIADKLSLENKLRQALERNEFILHYQPKVELEGRRIVGVEALMRWQSPELGMVAPIKFIPLLEEIGLIIEVGSWALSRAAQDQRAWLEAGLKAPTVAVNVSAIQLRQRDFVHIVQDAIGGSALPARIDLEITESLIMEDIQGSIKKLAALRELGMGIAIDDFGTGYSSLAYLARLPGETLKIDRSFISSMTTDPTTPQLEPGEEHVDLKREAPEQPERHQHHRQQDAPAVGSHHGEQPEPQRDADREKHRQHRHHQRQPLAHVEAEGVAFFIALREVDRFGEDIHRPKHTKAPPDC